MKQKTKGKYLVIKKKHLKLQTDNSCIEFEPHKSFITAKDSAIKQLLTHFLQFGHHFQKSLTAARYFNKY